MSPSYRLTGRLEAGDLAELYKASQEPGGAVVVKLFHPKTSDPGYARALAETSRVLNRLKHPGIVHYVDIGFVSERLAVVREHVDGYTLGTALQRLLTKEVLLPTPIALYLVIQLMELVQKAHEAGVIHGAITPGNLMLSREGAAGICDFGALSALMAVPELKRGFAPRGRSAYRAPEVTRGEEPTTISDIYSLGAIAYELLTLREAVVTGGGISTRNAGLPAPSRLDRRINSRLDPIILRALEPLPSRRYRSAGEFAMGLRNFLSSSGGLPGQEELRRFVRELVPNEVNLSALGPVPFSEPFRLTAVSGAEIAHLRAEPLEASVVTRPSFSRSLSQEEARAVSEATLPRIEDPRADKSGAQESTQLVPHKPVPWGEESTQRAPAKAGPAEEQESTLLVPHKPVPWREESTQLAPAPASPSGGQEPTQLVPHKPVPWGEESTQVAAQSKAVPWGENESTQLASHQLVPWGENESTQPTAPGLDPPRAAPLSSPPKAEPVLEPTQLRPPKAEPVLEPTQLRPGKAEPWSEQESTDVGGAPGAEPEVTDPHREMPPEKGWEAPPGALQTKSRKALAPMVGLPGAKEGTRVGRHPRLKWVEDFSPEKVRPAEEILEDPPPQPARAGTGVRAALPAPPARPLPAPARPPPSFVRPPPSEDEIRDTAPRERPEIPTPPPTDESNPAVTGDQRLYTEERLLLARERRQRQALAVVGVLTLVGLASLLIFVQFGLSSSDSSSETNPVTLGGKDTSGAPAESRRGASRGGGELREDSDSAFLSIRSNMPARVYVDGDLVGRRTPLMKFPVKPGDRTITVEAVATKERAEFSMRFEKGQHRTIDQMFKSVPRR